MESSMKLLVSLLLVLSSATYSAESKDPDVVLAGGEGESSPETKAEVVAEPVSASPISPLLSKACPFKKEVRGVKEILDSTKNQLTALASNTTCANVTSAAKVMSDSLTRSLENNFGSEQLTPEGVNCSSNYEQNFAVDYNLSLKMYLTDKTLVSEQYKICVDNANFNQCAQAIYVKQLSSAGASCASASRTLKLKQRNTQMTQVLTDLSNNAHALIKSTDGCNNMTVTSAVVQASLGTLTAYNSIMPSIGVAGIGLALGSRVVEALLDNLFSKNSPKNMMEAIKKEENMEDLNCLNFILQKETLQCEKLFLDSKPKEIAINLEGPCHNYYYGNNKKSSSIYSLAQELEKINTASSSQPTNDKQFDKIRELLSQTTIDPLNENKKIKFSEYLSNVATVLSKKGGVEAKINGKALKEFMKAYSDLETGLTAEGLPEEGAKSLVGLIDAFKTKTKTLANGANGSLFENAIENYWELNDQGSVLAQIKNYGRLKSDLKVGYDTSLELYKGLQDLEASSGAKRKLDVAHTSFVTSFKEQFQDRLSKLDSTFTRNKTYQEKADSAMDLVPLVQMCSLNAGIFYFGESDGDLKSRNNIVSSMPNNFKKACERFKCYMPLFDPKTIAEDKRAVAFRKYQCEQFIRYPKILENVQKDYNDKGALCTK